jgi:hypothetical protein
VGTLVRQRSEVARIDVISLAGFDHPPELPRIPESPAPVLRLAMTSAPSTCSEPDGGYLRVRAATLITESYPLTRPAGT